MTTVLAKFLPTYRRHHPGVEVLLVEGGAARQPSRLERGEVHLANASSRSPRWRTSRCCCSGMNSDRARGSMRRAKSPI